MATPSEIAAEGLHEVRVGLRRFGYAGAALEEELHRLLGFVDVLASVAADDGDDAMIAGIQRIVTVLHNAEQTLRAKRFDAARSALQVVEGRLEALVDRYVE